jgi:hypothetical protein
MTRPSGLIDGRRSRTTSSRRRAVCASSAVARACAHSIAICEAPTSVEWMLQVTKRKTLPSRTSASASASLRPRGSAILRAISWRRFFFARLASDEIAARKRSSPSVVFPRISISTRGEAASRALK